MGDTDHTAQPRTAAEARDALEAAARSRAAASERPPAPVWYPPARGLLFTAAFGVLLGPWSVEDARVLIAGLLAMLAFLLLHAAVVVRGGVLALPGGTTRQRLLKELVPAAAYAVGWLAALPFGHAGGAIASALLGGATLWAVTQQWENRARS